MLQAVEKRAASVARVVEGGSSGAPARLRLDGFETRMLKGAGAMTEAAQPPPQPHYVVAWRVLDTSVALDASHAPFALVLAGGAAHRDPPPAPSVARIGPGVLVSALACQQGVMLQRLLAVAATSLGLIQMSTRRSVPAWLFSAGMQSAGLAGASQPSHAGTHGLARCGRQEPAALLRFLDGDDICCALSMDGDDICRALSMRQLLGVAVSQEAARAAAPEQPCELEMATDGMPLRVPRLGGPSLSVSHPVRLHFDSRGAVTNLSIAVQIPRAGEIPEGFAVVKIGAVGLNFRDVLNVLGAYPGDPGPSGADCPATVVGAGPSCPSALVEGCMVVGWCHAPLASFSCTDAQLLASTARSRLDPEASCTLPTTWCTVHLASLCAQFQAGQRLQVHAAAGGIGPTALEYAQWLGMQLGTTAGRPNKQRFVRCVAAGRTACSSCDGGSFAIGAAVQLRKGQLHAVLNSLSLDFIAVSALLLVEGGCSEEIGKINIWSTSRMSAAMTAVLRLAVAATCCIAAALYLVSTAAFPLAASAMICLAAAAIFACAASAILRLRIALARSATSLTVNLPDYSATNEEVAPIVNTASIKRPAARSLTNSILQPTWPRSSARCRLAIVGILLQGHIACVVGSSTGPPSQSPSTPTLSPSLAQIPPSPPPVLGGVRAFTHSRHLQGSEEGALPSALPPLPLPGAGFVYAYMSPLHAANGGWCLKKAHRQTAVRLLHAAWCAS